MLYPYINIKATVLTDCLLKGVSNTSKDPENPISVPESNLFTVVSTVDEKETLSIRNRSNILEFKAVQESIIHLYLSSEYGNFIQPAILYDLKVYFGDHVLKPALNLVKDNVETVIPTGFNPLEITTELKDFWFCDSLVIGQGTCLLGLCYAIFESDLTLLGYFQSFKTITIS